MTVDPGRVVHFFPDYRADNPSQAMLYSGLASIGARAAPVPNATEHLAHQAATAEPGLLHLHWTAPILQPAKGPFSAKLALDEFTGALRAFRAAGGRLVWTIHNVLPHDVRHRWAEIELARTLADVADAIHVRSEATCEEVRHLYPLDRSKVTVIPMASYLGRYPMTVSRLAARERLGLHPQEKALISLGQIRPYKGLDRLVRSFEILVDRDPSLRLLIAGRPGNQPGVGDLIRAIESSPRVLSRLEHVADDELQVWMGAADLAVLPYRDILDSGAYKLAQTFGLPLVGPRSGSLRADEGKPFVRLFDPADDDSLTTELAHAIADFIDDRDGSARARAASRAAAEGFTAAEMGAEFARFIEPLLSVRVHEVDVSRSSQSR